MSRLAQTDAQRRMDGLHRLVMRGVAAPPDAVAPEPLVNIMMTKTEYDATRGDAGRRAGEARHHR